MMGKSEWYFNGKFSVFKHANNKNTRVSLRPLIMRSGCGVLAARFVCVMKQAFVSSICQPEIKIK